MINQIQSVKSIPYHIALSQALNIYANGSSTFKRRIEELKLNFNFSEGEILSTEYNFERDNPLIPPNEISAQKRLNWLIAQIINHNISNRDECLNSLFSTNILEREDPKLMFFGLRASVRYGPVAGDMIADKKSISQYIILHTICGDCTKYEISKIVHDASVGALYESVESANFDFSELDPEVLEWFVGKRNLQMFIANSDTDYNSVINKVNKFNIPSYRLSKEGIYDLIALKPAYGGSYEPIINKLEAISF